MTLVRFFVHLSSQAALGPRRSFLSPRLHPVRSMSSFSPSVSLYDILGVKTNADQQTIKEAFFRLSKEHHPDLNPDKEDASETFKNLAAAYEVLSNAESRTKYDKESGIRKAKMRTVDREAFRSRSSPIYRTGSLHGVDSEFGRRIEVDLSAERMAKAWEAYKKRWAIEEERLRILEEKKKKFRKDLDEARAAMYANMTLQEREELREHMRLLRMPRVFKETDLGDARTDRTSTQKDSSADTFREGPSNKTDSERKRTKKINIESEPETKNKNYDDYADPLFSDIPKDSSANSNYHQDFFSQGMKNSQSKLDAIKENWRNTRFFEDQTGSSHKYGLYRSHEMKIGKVFVAVVLILFFTALFHRHTLQE